MAGEGLSQIGAGFTVEESRVDPKVLPLEALIIASIAQQREKNPDPEKPYTWSA